MKHIGHFWNNFGLFIGIVVGQPLEQLWKSVGTILENVGCFFFVKCLKQVGNSLDVFF